MGKGKIKGLVKALAGKAKKKIKGELSKDRITERAVDAVKEGIKDRSRSQRRGKKVARLGQPREAEADIMLSKNIKLGGRKKAKQKKKIKQWESEKKLSLIHI